MSIIKKPLITEKGTAKNDKGVYGFVVAKSANKVEIKQTIEKMYGVKVQNVRTMIAAGKAKSRFSNGSFLSGKTASYKKALVTVAAGEVIDFYSSI
jgi:large subunit ribosomal protein L23